MASDSTRIVADGNDGTSAGTSTPATPSSMEARQEAEEYALKLSARVKSFDTAPLHSTAYMGYLAKYLRRPFKQPRQNRSVPQYRPKARTFIDRYVIRPDRLPDVSRFTEPTDFTASAIPAANEIVFLRGRPSAEWLNEVGRTYKLDHRFFHSHLAATVSTHVHFYATPTLPSRTAGILKFRIPTIVQVGAPGRDLDVEQLEYARHKCYEHLRKMFRSIQDCTAEPGQSIIRAINIHSGMVRRGEQLSVIVWTDAGAEDGVDHVPVPMTDGFSAVANQLSFCPTFFENDLVKGQLYPLCPGTSGEEMCRQPMVLLSSQYGSTIDWTQPVGATAISIIQELLTFEACAVLQYLNMLEVISADFMKRTQFPSYEHTKLETILHFDYMKEVLSRWKSHLLELSAFVKDSPEVWRRSKTEQSSPTQRQRHLEISNDLAYLKERADSLITTCDDGEATLMSNASVQEAKRSAREASLVTELAKATNRLTFIFLPISFITSVFGMNFSQFGQGPLSIWIWVVIACPMLIFSVIIVEKGSWIKRQVQRVRPKTAYDS